MKSWETERERLAFLKSAPLPQNDPAIMAPTRVKVLKAAFCIKGKPVKVDSIITIPYCDAQSLEVTGKIEILEKQL